ncbi:hypothetical protein FRC10_004678 [Ceratobasidium sp. 414]|nr:hypothetical protein FRC10_004678 [Ceratobasidium sp. 414]
MNTRQDYGRNRDSLADIEERLAEVFEAVASTATNEDGVPVIPTSELPKILAEYSKRHGAQLLSSEGELQLRTVLDANPDAELTPALTITLVAGLAKTVSGDNPPPSPSKDDPKDSRSDSSGASSPDTELRGRGEDTPHHPQSLSRTSSNSSFQAPGAPATPLSGRITSSSPFDSTARRRSTPLSAAAPSAWTRKPLPASRRRRSDAGSNGGNKSSSDNESSPAVARNPRRARAPSNPVSPRQESFPPSSFSNSTSSPFSSSDHRLLSASKRSHSFDQSIGMSQTLVDPDFSYAKSIKTPALKFHSSGSDSDTDPEEQSEDEDMTRRYVRPALSSDASLAPEDLLQALQKSHAELARKAADSERRMQNRLAERETEIAELEAQLDDLKTELSSSRREEKELRVKERASMAQFATFESEIQKLQKSLDHLRAQYSSMQKQYQEQCTETERMRNLLRRKEQEMKGADDRAYVHEGEVQKWAREREALENSIESLEVELNVTRQAVNELDEQKQENLLLKETIDRMRFDLDALRAGMGPSAAHEGQGTLSRSLANEIREGFERREREREREEAHDADEVDGIVVEHQGGEGSEDGYIETTITTSRKRVGTRSKPVIRLDDGNMREYVDASAQHDESEFLTTAGVQHQESEFSAIAEVQTDVKVVRNTEVATEPPRLQDVEIGTEHPHMQNAGIETEAREFIDANSGTETPEVREVQTEAWAGIECGVGPDSVGGVDMGVGTEVPEVTHAEVGTGAGVGAGPGTCEAEVQTDLELIPSPCVPTAITTAVPGPADLPPPYPQAAESGVLKRWHSRRTHRAPGSVHAREEWAALKRLVGVECQVIERVIEGQDIDNLVEDKDDEDTEPTPSRARKLFRVSFEFTSWPYLLTHAVMGFGVWSLAAAVVVNQLVPQTPTYADRMNWSAYNNYAGALGEGLVGRNGDSTIWSMIERLVLGAAVRVGPVSVSFYIVKKAFQPFRSIN